MKRLAVFIFIILASCSDKKVDGNNKLIVNNRSTKDTTYYFLLDKKRDTVLKLDPKKYFVCFSDTVENFLVVAPRSRKGWWAIDLNENYLFQVYNTSPGEPSPDKLNDGEIRIVDEHGKIGFANDKGEITIKPQFEFVTEFSNGKAIIGQSCKKVPWEKHQDDVDNHYSILCDKYGYINKKGEIMELGNFTYEEIAKKINFGG
ncbi:MAG TPA: WG repeat-containing protein [Chitinophagaceae bacterium]